MTTGQPIAVVGMHGRFPGGPDLQAFRALLQEGRDAIAPIPPERWKWQDYDSEHSASEETTYCHQGGFTPYVDRFDPRFFGILPREAQIMDPQQRLFLQAAWAALEDAGYAPSQLGRHRVGVFVGVGHADYPGLMLRDGVPSDPWRGTGIALTAIANRVSFTLDLQGPSESIDTACSSSLVAIHRATQALQAGECDLAIVGGVNLLLGPELFIAFAKAGMLSRTGHCQTFAADADGYVRGEGVAALVLAPLAAARANGDYLYGQICASAQNHGGRAHSFTAPNPTAQAEVISRAWAQSGYALHQASMIETHGTGTPLGDPIEINALKKVLEHSTSAASPPGSPIALGALKSQIGHLEAAAGIASVIKTLLCLNDQRVVGNLHHQRLNPHIDLDATPFYLPLASTALPPSNGGPRLAGVSAFGFGGVNAHVVLKTEAPRDEPELTAPGAPYLVLLSARDEPGLQVRVRQLLRAFGEPLPSATEHTRQRLLEHLHHLLGLPAPAAQRPAVRLATLEVTASVFVGCLEQALEDLKLDTPIDAWRGAITLDEVVERLVAEAELEPVIEARLDGLGALPASEMATASLARIARTLQEGRDAMASRLALVVERRDQLFECLHAYLSAPHTLDARWFNSHSEQPSSPVPQAGAHRATAEELVDRAHHWATSKAPHPDWTTLYPAEARPTKIPLPTYPFKLDRLWYQASHAVIPAVPAAAVSSAQAWLDCWEPDTQVPGSLMALSCLFGHAQPSAPGKILHWTDLHFGPPVTLAPEQRLHCELIRQRVQVTLDNHVLLQAHPQPAPQGMIEPAPAQLTGQTLTTEAFYGALAEQALVYRPFGRWLQSVVLTPDGLKLVMPLAGAPDDERLRARLLSSLIGALAYLDPGNVGLPYRIQSLSLDPARLHELHSLSLTRQAATSLFDVSGSTRSGACVLRLQGLEKRAWQNRATAQAVTA